MDLLEMMPRVNIDHPIDRGKFIDLNDDSKEEENSNTSCGKLSQA